MFCYSKKEGSTRFGRFDDVAREYIVSRPDTPLPWINYLGTTGFFGLISNTGAGYSFYRDARLRRLLRFRYNAPSDPGGRYLYVRDDESGAFWAPSWRPTQDPLDDYRCRHGLGYTVIGSGREGIDVETTYLIAPGEALEIWRTKVTNARATSARLSLFGAVEFCLWDAHDDATNLQRNLSTGEVEVAGGVIFHKTEYRERRNHFAYFACSEKARGFDTQRDVFLGPHRGWERPLAVERGSCSDSTAHGWAPCAAHHVEVELEPGASKDIVFLLGYSENPPSRKFDAEDRIDKTVVRPVIKRYLKVDAVDDALDRLREGWSETLSAMQVSTPNEHVDRMVNTWNPYQCMVTFNLSRSASSFETGVGRGMGFRDSNQDLLGFVHMAPARARERLLDLAATQLPNGGAYHQYQPLTKRGNDAVGSGFNDDPLWLILAVAAYVKETGDLRVLDEPAPYDNTDGSETPLYEHLLRALRYTTDRLGPDGLPLIGRADWNDCLNLNAFSEEPGESFQTVENRSGGVATSVFIAGLFALAASELAGLADGRGASEDAAGFRELCAEMQQTVRDHGWDGSWFRRAYDYFGDVIGSSTNDQGSIFVEPQGMCVMGGIGLDDRKAERALESVAIHLATDHGIALVHPAFRSYDAKLGEITSYPPGYKENGGVFCHTNPWIVIAETLVGNGDRALDYYLRINPSVREDVGEIHRCEPYVYAQMIAGPEAPTHGEAKNSWLTGSAAWNFVAVTQWILGIRPELDGLRIDPCLPSDWDGFTATRIFRGATYEIAVTKGSGITGRISSLVVDGTKVDGNLVPPAPEGTTVSVQAAIGG